MNKLTKYLAYLILILTIIFNLWLNFPETQILADPNDNIFQYSLVGRTNWVWENYGCPFSLSCLPNLIDHNVPNWAEGYPLPFYYSHVPQIAIVSSYNLIVKPISSLFDLRFSLYAYYNWTKYLLLTFFPLSVFFALRIVGFSPILAALGAFLGANFSTDGLYGIDPPSYLWRGYGLTSQLYALIFLPLGIAFVYKALSLTENAKDTSDGVLSLSKHSSEVKEPEKDFFQIHLPGGRIGFILNGFTMKDSWKVKYLILAILFLTLTTAGHLGIGIIGLLSTMPFLLIDASPRNIIARGKKLFLILASCFLILSYWIIPILLNNNYHIISFWDPIWKFNSYGWYEVARQFFAGEIFDWQRFPLLTILTVIGFFVLSIRKEYLPFALLFAFWFLMYFGRTTWGGLIDLIPGMRDFHQQRFIVGVHIAGLFLIPAGLNYIFDLIKTTLYYSILIAVAVFRKFFLPSSKGEVAPSFKNTPGVAGGSGGARHDSPGVKELDLSKSSTSGEYFAHPRGVLTAFTNPIVESYLNIIFYIVTFIFTSLLIYFTAKQTVAYAQLNNKWIYQANDAYRYDEKNFQNMLTQIDKSQGRIYAGRPGNWGKGYRLGSTQLYLLLGGIGYDISQFLPETWSPMSENEQDFDEREALDYDLLNIRYVVASKNEGFAPSVKLTDKYGPFELYKAPTTGWFDVVTSPMFVKTDKTNYINLVHLWWRSYSRRWKMHPLISVETNPEIPQGMQRIIRMTDEVSYFEETVSDKDTSGVAEASKTPRGWPKDSPEVEESKKRYNIFSDFPFVFPEATISAYLKNGDKSTPGVVGRIKESLKDTSGVTGTQGLPRGGEIEKNVAIISNEKVSKQTYSATVDIPQDCKFCMIMFKMSYHPNWQVKVDGQKASKFAVFPFYLAVSATPGEHQVEFTYKPNSLKVFLLILELFALIFLLSYIIRKSIRPNNIPSNLRP